MKVKRLKNSEINDIVPIYKAWLCHKGMWIETPDIKPRILFVKIEAIKHTDSLTQIIKLFKISLLTSKEYCQKVSAR